mgnify:FL=1
MNSKGIILVAGVILVLIILPFSIFFLSSGVSSQNTSSTTSSSKSVTSSKSASVSKGLTLSEVAKHNTESDCYMIVNSKVYDVTAYLPYHPGGASRIIQYCGQDGTQALETKGGEGQHSNRAGNDLSSLFVGDLSN